LTDVKKEIEEVKIAVDKHQDSHDKLRLYDIEWVLFDLLTCVSFLTDSSRDDDDDDSDDDEEGDKPEGSTPEGDEDAEMKPEDEEAPRKPVKKGQELKLYTEQELRGFKQKELIADTELLDGVFALTDSIVDFMLMRTHNRTYQERQGRLDRSQGVQET
jgi:structural maintenance of chromosome 4